MMLHIKMLSEKKHTKTKTITENMYHSKKDLKTWIDTHRIPLNCQLCIAAIHTLVFIWDFEVVCEISEEREKPLQKQKLNKFSPEDH